MEVVVAAMLVLLAGARSQEHGGDSGLASGLRLARSAYLQCQQGGQLLACLQLRALKVVDRALGAKRIPLLDGVELVRTGEGAGPPQGEGLAPLDEEGLARDPDKFGSMMLDRAARFLDTHAVRINHRRLFGDEDALEDGARGKKIKYLGGLLMMGGLMKAGLLAMSLAGLAALAGTALIVSKIALLLSAMLGLSKLLAGSGSKVTTYEVVKPAVHSEHGGDYGGGYYGTSGGGGGHYGRSLGDAQPLAYKALVANNSIVQS